MAARSSAANAPGFLDTWARTWSSLGSRPRSMARHARHAVLDQPVRALGVADDVDRRLVHALAPAVDEQVALQAVGQVEDDLAAGVLKRVAAGSGTEGMLEEVLPADVVGEIVAAPVGAVAAVMAFDEAVVSSDAGAVEAGPDHVVVLDVGQDIDVEQAFQAAIGAGQLQEIMVEGRPGGGGDEPVAAHGDDIGAGQGSQLLLDAGGFLQAIGIGRGQAVPLPCGPAVIAEIDAVDTSGPASSGVGRLMRGCQDRLLTSLARACRCRCMSSGARRAAARWVRVK